MAWCTGHRARVCSLSSKRGNHKTRSFTRCWDCVTRSASPPRNDTRLIISVSFPRCKSFDCPRVLCSALDDPRESECGFQLSAPSPLRLSASSSPFFLGRPRSKFFFSTSYRLSLSVSLEHPRVTVRPRRWTGEDWRFAIAATCSTASKAPKESHGVPSVTRFSPVGREQSYLPIGARLFPDLPMGPYLARSFNQSWTASFLETDCPGTSHRFPTLHDTTLLHSQLAKATAFRVLRADDTAAEDWLPAA